MKWVDDIYVINLKKDVKRLSQFSHLMSRLNWNWNRFEAIDTNDLISNINTQHMRNKYINPIVTLSAGEICCFLSHITLWKKLIDSNKNRFLIFEDDASTLIDGPSVEEYIDKFYNHVTTKNTNEPLILYLGKSLDYCTEYKHIVNRVYQSIRPLCLHAYIINRQAAINILANSYGIAIDLVPIELINQNCGYLAVFHPSLFFQDSIDSLSNLRSKNSQILNTSECVTSVDDISKNILIVTIVILVFIIGAITINRIRRHNV